MPGATKPRRSTEVRILLMSQFPKGPNTYMRVRQYSIYNPVPWKHGGVLWLLRVLAQLKTKVSLLGFLPQDSHALVLD